MQFKCQTILFEAILFSISALFSSIWPIDRTQSVSITKPEWPWERWQWRGTSYFPKLPHYGNLTIRLFSVIFRTLFGKSYASVEMQSVYSTVPADGATRHLLWKISPLQRCSWCILQPPPKPTGQKLLLW